MIIPENMPKLKWAVFLWSVVAVVWIVLEGNLWLTVLFGMLTALIVTGMLAKRTLSGRILSLRRWLMIMALGGLILGLGSAFLTLFFMAMKTGLHAHGPEFTSIEVNWVVQQMPIWAAAGLVAGLGFGLLMKAMVKPED